jgi:acyl-CoA synthetase (AMP-forming)/AMP-acid ligase II
LNINFEGLTSRLDDSGHLILMGRKEDIIVLSSGLNVYPEDIENALRTAVMRDAVVVETRPGEASRRSCWRQKYRSYLSPTSAPRRHERRTCATRPTSGPR